MKILVTGHRGFIGQNMVKSLADHTISTYEWGDPLPTIKGLDWVIHLGAISSTAETDRSRLKIQNIDSSKWMFHECIRNGVNLQYASSASVYGNSLNFKETAVKYPNSLYADSKLTFDNYVSQYPHDIIVQGFRYFNVYGPHEDHKGSQASPYETFKTQALATGVIQIFIGSDEFCRDFVPVATVIDVHKCFFNVSKSGIWNVGSGIPTSFQSIAEHIAQQYNATIEYVTMPEEMKIRYQRYTCADLTELYKLYDPNRN